MSMHGEKSGKEFKNIKTVPSSIETEVRAYKRYADSDKKRTSKCIQYVKPINNILYSAK